MSKHLFIIVCAGLIAFFPPSPVASQLSHPRLMADKTEILRARDWISKYAWYRSIFEAHRKDIDRFIQHGPIYVSPLKQTYQYQMYLCPKHNVDLIYDEFEPFKHRCPIDTNEVYSGGRFDASWAGWYNRLLASRLVWMGILYQVYDDPKYAEAGREILLKFADLYLQYPTTNTILGPAHVFFGTLSESFWGVDMAFGYDLLYDYKGFTEEDRTKLKEKLFYPLAEITQQFPESASNRQLWYNNVSAAVGYLYGDQKLVDFALKGKYGFYWQLGSALPESGFWAEWSGYHFVTLRGMIYLAEMARHNGLDLYHAKIAGRTMKKMFDAPFELILPNYEFPRCKDSGGGNLLEYSTYYEVGYAVYHDPRYLELLNLTHVVRGKQIVGETSAIGEADQPVTLFNLEPVLPKTTGDIYPPQSVNLEGNGFAVLRNGQNDHRRYLYLDYGIMGGEHGHPDRLSLGYYANGRNWIVDPLNELYTNPNLQLWYRQTIAHNTIVINQTTQTWANGYGIFFGAMKDLQVASGGTTTAYPGTSLKRTLIQFGDYFLDLFDVAAPEPRLIDWPLHSFGSLELSGVSLKPEPIDLFGHQPGIPGYDQLTDIQSARTDSAWSGVFSENGQHLMIKAIGEKGTEVYQAISPRIGGFYKQMVKDPKPMPMLFSRRKTSATRFAHLLQAYDRVPTVSSFEKGNAANTYVVKGENGNDLIYADVDHSVYWIVRSKDEQPLSISGFNVSQIKMKNTVLMSSDFPLSQFACRWTGENLDVTVPENFSRVRVRAPGATSLMVNGLATPVQRDGDFVVIRLQSGIAMDIIRPDDSTLFLGTKNRLSVRVWNPSSKTAVEGRVTLTLSKDWSERVNSQLHWWGGIVNLKATNKGPIERTVAPASYTDDASWINGIHSSPKRIPAGGSETFELSLNVPNNGPPVTYPVDVSFGSMTVHRAIRVIPPVASEIVFPDAQKEVLWVTVTNQTDDRRTISTRLIPDKAWVALGPLSKSTELLPGEKRRLLFPLRLSGYNAGEQLYPISLKIESGGYQTEIIRDMYVGVAHAATSPPSLDGSWKGWTKSTPITIDKPNQVCRLLMGNQPWHGPKDLSAKIYVMYDPKYLYVGADVTDDSVVTHWNFPVMSYPWDTDCMEVVLDTRTDAEQGHDPPTPGLFRHLSMADYRTTDFGPSMWQGGGAGGPLLPKPNLVPGAETYYTRTARGYAMICRYPLSELPQVVARPGYKIGFDAAINDNDGTSYRKNQHIWAGFNQNQSWWDMGTIGALIFGGRK
jgi:hypothetical protein